MAKIFEQAYLEDRIVPIGEAHLSVASAAVLYGLSVYTVFPLWVTEKGLAAFRLRDHYQRLLNFSPIDRHFHEHCHMAICAKVFFATHDRRLKPSGEWLSDRDCKAIA